MSNSSPFSGEFRPGTVVIGPFFSDGRNGVGIVRVRSNGPRSRSWRNVGPDYEPVEILVGDRVNGGYRPTSLAKIPRVKEVRA